MKVTAQLYGQFLVSSQVNYTGMYLADHLDGLTHDHVGGKRDLAKSQAHRAAFGQLGCHGPPLGGVNNEFAPHGLGCKLPRKVGQPKIEVRQPDKT